MGKKGSRLFLESVIILIIGIAFLLFVLLKIGPLIYDKYMDTANVADSGLNNIISDSTGTYTSSASKSCRQSDIKFTTNPIDGGKITSCYGSRPGYGDEWHDGVDFAQPEGTPVKAVADGIYYASCNSGFCNGYGTNILIYHEQFKTFTRYNHLSAIKISGPLKSEVKEGDVIGLVGNTGVSTGAHLDFKVYPPWAPPSVPEKEGDYSRNPRCFFSPPITVFDNTCDA